jgi:hypothetical protein
MAILCPDISTSIEKAVGAASISFGSAMAIGEVWMFTSNTACWIKQGTGVTASAANGSMYTPANVDRNIDGAGGPDLAVIQDAAGGKASLTRMVRK